MKDPGIVEAIDIMRRAREKATGWICPACMTDINKSGYRSRPTVELDHTDDVRSANRQRRFMDEIAEFWEAHL